MLKSIFRVIFLASVSFLGIFLWTVSIGQVINYEFRDYKTANIFYNIILFGAPVATLLTLTGTLKKRYDFRRKGFTILATVTLTVLCCVFVVNILFSIGFGRWTTFNIAYEYKSNPQRQIREQRYDSGAFGYGSWRIVEVNPFAGLFWHVRTVDTTVIDKTRWFRIDKDADIKFP